MKKKYFLTVLAVTLIVSLTLICFSGCRKKSDSTANKNTDSNEIKLSVGENSSEENEYVGEVEHLGRCELNTFDAEN